MAKTRKELTPTERLEKLEEQRQRTYRSIVKTALEANPALESMRDAYRKTKRYLTEASNLLTDEGFAKQEASIDARIARLQESKQELAGKREVAELNVDSLRETVAAHESAQAAIGEELVKHINGGNVPTDEDTLNAIVNSVLDAVDTNELTVCNDPFVNYRAAARKAAEENEEENSEQE